jgi:hypothetical protein
VAVSPTPLELQLWSVVSAGTKISEEQGKGPGMNAGALRLLARSYGPTSRVTMFAGSLAVVMVKNGKKAAPLCPRPT